MKAKLVSSMPSGGDWIYEIKFDGYRALALRGDGETRILSRNQKDLGGKFPEVKDSIAALDIQDRGFIQAGVQNLLMTLWPISDEVTVQIMSDFYEAAHKTGNAPEALAEVQRDWLVKLRKEEGLANAVNLAGPFVMSSQGKP
jgi:CHAT domain/ATP dependent DNA ligase domain